MTISQTLLKHTVYLFGTVNTYKYFQHQWYKICADNWFWLKTVWETRSQDVFISTCPNTDGPFQGPGYIGPASTSNWPGKGESESESESELLYNWRSVSQYVLVSSTIWDFWPDFFFFKLQPCLIWGALSDERSGLSFVSLQSVYSSQSVFT
jgi:hypothetical protein